MTGALSILLSRREAFRRCAGLFAALLLLVAAAGPAFAHASLVSTVPADGSVAETPPERFSLLFSEPVSPLVLALVAPDGTRTELAGWTLRDRTVEIPAPAGLGRGTHVLVWRVISEDGHPIGGASVFSVGAAGAVPAVAEPVDWPVRAGLWTGKVLLYCGLFLGVGGLFMRAWLGGTRGASVRLPAGLILVGLAGAAASLGFQGLDALGAPAGRLLDPDVWQAGLRTSFGLTAVSAVAAFFLALACWPLPRSQVRGLSLFALVMAGAALAASGHASAAEPQWLMRPAVFVHAVTIALWTGALLPLAQMLREGGPQGAVALRRFSLFIPFAVAALAAAGVVLGIVQVETPSALWTTAYGRVFSVKLALLLSLFALAAVNRWRLTARVAQGEEAASRHMLRSIKGETALVLLIFAVAALWRFTPPPRALAAAANGPAEVHVHMPEATAEMRITPGRVGAVSVRIALTADGYSLPQPKEVAFSAGNKAAGIEPIRRRAARLSDGTWGVDDFVLPVPGLWQVRADVLISDFKLVRIPGEVVIRP